jgi:hypothetical protein
MAAAMTSLTACIGCTLSTIQNLLGMVGEEITSDQVLGQLCIDRIVVFF